MASPETAKHVASEVGELAAAAIQAADLLAALSAQSKQRGHDSTAQLCGRAVHRLLAAVAGAAGERT